MNARQRRADRRAFRAWRAREAAKPKEFDWSTSAPPSGRWVHDGSAHHFYPHEALRARPNHWLGGSGPMISADGAPRLTEEQYELLEVDHGSRRLAGFEYGPTVFTLAGREGT